MNGTFHETARDIPVMARPDVLVVGGGAAGTAAAMAAAREGAEVLLVERYGFLGGTLTAVTLGGFCGAYTVDGDSIARTVGGIYVEMEERMRSRDAVLPPRHVGRIASVPYDPPSLRLVSDEMVAEAGVSVLFHAFASAVYSEDGKVRTVVLETKGGRKAVMPKVVIDCTGDGDVAALAGCPYELGDGGITQFGSSMFRLAGVDVAACREISRDGLRDILQQASDKGYDLPRTAAAMYVHPIEGTVHLNTTRVARPDGQPFNLVDPLELSAAEIEGRRQAYLYEEVFRRFVPGFERARIVDLGAQIGIRESRLIRCDQVLTKDHIYACAKPMDRIACNSWPIEVHAQGTRTVWEYMPDGEYYGIPYGCLTPVGVDNLWVAGRNISATHEAQASARVSSPCYALGQAAGTAAALSLDHGCDSRAVSVPALQRKLKDAGAILSL
ncbi:FAD-dependent oxidoreductase [Mesorhizobium sp. ANAO-SY3R2]